MQKTLTMEQIMILLEKSKESPIHMQVLFNVLMGLRRSEINGVKYSDVDYINHTLKVERQLGRVHNAAREDFAPKTLTKQEVGLKTKSSYRIIPIVNKRIPLCRKPGYQNLFRRLGFSPKRHLKIAISAEIRKTA